MALRVLLSLILFIGLATGPAQAGSARTVTDMVGRKVVLAGPARRIITTFRPATHLVVALGLGERLVGIDHGYGDLTLARAVTPGIAQVAQVGSKMSGVNLETAVALKPDLAVTFSQHDGMALADRMTALGIPTVVILPEDLPRLKESLTLIAEAAGEPERARRVIGAMDGVLDLVAQRVGDIPPERRPVVYYAGPLGFFSTASGEMMQGRMIEMAGGQNAGDQLKGYFQRVSPEQVVAWDPALIVASQRLSTNLTAALARPEMASVAAVRDQRVKVFPANLAAWDLPTPLAVLGVLWLAKELHPSAMADVDLAAQVDELHRVLYGKGFAELGGRLDDEPGR